jgi:hypothetical protein
MEGSGSKQGSTTCGGGRVINIVRPARSPVVLKCPAGEQGLGEESSDSGNIQRARRHSTHRRQQLFRIERLVEKLIRTDCVASLASFNAACRSHD